MKFSAYRVAIALTTASALFSLAGCGGGGGGDSTGPAPDHNAAIKSSNASNVGAQAYWALDFLNSQINAGALNVASATDSDYSDKLCKGLDGIVRGSSTRRVDTGTNTVTLTDVNCNNGVWVSNGTQTIKLSNLVGNPFQDVAWKGTLTVTFDFSTTFDPITASQTGDLVIDYDQTAPNVGTFHVTNNNLQSRLAAGSLVVERNISKLLYTGSIDASGLNTFNATFTLAGNFGKLLGTTSYDVRTKTDFKRLITDQKPGKPFQGGLIATASDKSALTLTPVDVTTARIEVDWNGDSVIDSSTTASWTTLDTQGTAINLLY